MGHSARRYHAGAQPLERRLAAVRQRRIDDQPAAIRNGLCWRGRQPIQHPRSVHDVATDDREQPEHDGPGSRVTAEPNRQRRGFIDKAANCRRFCNRPDAGDRSGQPARRRECRTALPDQPDTYGDGADGSEFRSPSMPIGTHPRTRLCSSLCLGHCRRSPGISRGSATCPRDRGGMRCRARHLRRDCRGTLGAAVGAPAKR